MISIYIKGNDEPLTINPYLVEVGFNFVFDKKLGLISEIADSKSFFTVDEFFDTMLNERFLISDIIGNLHDDDLICTTNEFSVTGPCFRYGNFDDLHYSKGLSFKRAGKYLLVSEGETPSWFVTNRRSALSFLKYPSSIDVFPMIYSDSAFFQI